MDACKLHLSRTAFQKAVWDATHIRSHVNPENTINGRLGKARSHGLHLDVDRCSTDRVPTTPLLHNARCPRVLNCKFGHDEPSGNLSRIVCSARFCSWCRASAAPPSPLSSLFTYVCVCVYIYIYVCMTPTGLTAVHTTYMLQPPPRSSGVRPPGVLHS